MSKSEIAIEDVIKICHDCFSEFKGLKMGPLENDEFHVKLQNGKEYYVSIDECDMEDEDNGRSLNKKCEQVYELEDHTDVLDLCIYALSKNNQSRKAISNFSTDGDHKDCEAIFLLDDHIECVLKVR